MTRKRSAATARRRAKAIPNIAQTASQLSDIALSSGKVVTHRIGMAIEAMNNPRFSEHAEFTTMATEKMDAMVDVAQGFFESMWSMGRAFTGMAIGQTSGLADAAMAIGTATNPLAVISAQQQWAADTFAQAHANTMRMTALFADVASSAVKPVHSRVTANANRLGKRGL